MDIDVAKLRGNYVYLELLSPAHRETLRSLARNELIWEFNKMLSIDDSYDVAYNEYFTGALDKNGLGGQQTFAIRKTIDGSIIGMTRLYEMTQKKKPCLSVTPGIYLRHGERHTIRNVNCCCCNMFLKS